MNEAEPRVSLKECNSLRLPARCQRLLRASSRAQLLQQLEDIRHSGEPLLVLGGGTNLVLRGDFPGTCLQVASRGIRLLSSDDREVRVEVQAGEPWHPFVLRCLEEGWHGLENLALIPGTLGAAPIQNIGAYGVEVGKFIEAVEVVERESGRLYWLDGAECGFGYRDSHFKKSWRDRLVILSLRLRLSRQYAPVLDYPALDQALTTEERRNPAALVAAVTALRRHKLPDPEELPNVGSFFKNPLLSEAHYLELRQKYPGLSGHPGTQGVKVPAGWLLERAGWKGVRWQGVGVHDRQALVLIHEGGADGERLLGFAARIQDDIQQRFGIALEIEPRIY